MAHRRILAALIAVSFTDSLAEEFLQPLLVVLLEGRGASAFLIGLATSVGDLGMLLAAPFVPTLVRVIRPVHYVRGSLLLLAFGVFLFPLLPHVAAWIAIEFAFGLVTCGFFVMSDSLVNAAAADSLRGRMLASYVFAESGGAIVGPLLLGVVGFEGLLPFCVASAIMLAGIAPWFLVDVSRAPDLGGGQAVSLFAVLRSAPFVLLMVAAGTFFEDVPQGLLPVFALESGLGQTTAMSLLAVLAAGSLAFQLPSGWAADRIGQQPLLVVAGVAAVGLSLALPALTGTWAMWLALPLLGGALQVFELVGLMLLGTRATPLTLAGLNAAATLSRSVTGFLAPPATGWLMDRAGPGALFAALAGVAALVVSACWVESARRARLRSTQT